MTILANLDRERLYNEITLSKGAHTAGDAACLMEMTSLLAGERHSDNPSCVCPVITRFAIQVNDRLPDDLRQMLKPYAPAFIGTRDGQEKQRREYLANRAVKVFAPFYLRRAKMEAEAARLEALADNDWAANRAACDEVRRKVTADFNAAAFAAADAYDAAFAAASAAAAAFAADADADADAAFAAAATTDATYGAAKSALVAIMPLIIETFDALILIGADKRVARPVGVILPVGA